MSSDDIIPVDEQAQRKSRRGADAPLRVGRIKNAYQRTTVMENKRRAAEKLHDLHVEVLEAIATGKLNRRQMATFAAAAVGKEAPTLGPLRKTPKPDSEASS